MVMRCFEQNLFRSANCRQQSFIINEVQLVKMFVKRLVRKAPFGIITSFNLALIISYKQQLLPIMPKKLLQY